MIQNRRAYQLIHCKTHSRLLAAAAAGCGMACGAADLALHAAFGSRRESPLPSPAAARTALEAVYPKPASDAGWPTLPPAEPGIDLSVIVPVYNGASTIDACLQSILQQKTSYTVQLIVVDSDSSDATPALLQRYCSLPHVVLANCTTPHTAAAARNEGLLHAVGRWVLFVDSDDLLLPGAVQTLLDAAVQKNADIVQGGWQYLYPDDSRGAVQTYADAVYTGSAALGRFELPGVPWGKVYRRELFAQIRFPSHYRCFEDSIIHFLVFRTAKTVASIQATVYLWRKNPAGLTSSNQHRPTAVLSYWLVEELLAQDAALGLAHDVMFCCSLTLQLSGFCYATLSGLDSQVQRTVFALCCALYASALPQGPGPGQPYRVRAAARTLQQQRFALWCRYGRRFQLL